ncbi:MAG: SH3 domain-containing protein [Lachnospiraceae bacterium]|nr:SH3 domain-containing protein [Lachnospiraceae bacterium]
MKKKFATRAGSMLLAAALGVSGACGAGTFVFAEEEAETAVAELETEAAEEETEAAEPTEIEVTLDGTALTIRNETGLAVSEVSAADLTADEDGENDAEEGTDSDSAESTGEEPVGLALVFTLEDGTEHVFEVSEASELTALADLTLTEKIGFFFLSGTDANGDAKVFYETADEITLEEPVTMYAIGSVTIREEADGSSEALGYVDRGSEVEVLGGTSVWFLVKQSETTGYVAARYLTTDEAEAQAAVEAEASAQAAAQAAAAAAAQDAAAQAAAAAAAAAASTAAAAAAASTAADSSSGTTETPATDDACLTGGVLN